MSPGPSDRQLPPATVRVDGRPTTGTPVASPCNGVCRMSPATGCCEGCGRTLDEIAAWGSLDDDGRRAVLDGLARRGRQRREG